MSKKMSFQQGQHELVALLGGMARKTPLAYTLLVLLVACVGYVYVLLVLAVTAGILVIAIRQIPALVPGVALGAILLLIVIVRGLWVRLAEPTGTRVRRDDAPRLFEEIDQIREAVGGPPVHVVLVSDDFAVAAAQRPRLGIFGWQRNYILLGLKALMALSPEHARALLAHEYAHITSAHGRAGAWVSRTLAAWSRIAESPHRQSVWSRWLLQAFLRRYVRLFEIFSLLLRRRYEYEADAMAARIAGSRCSSEALFLHLLQARALYRQFWPELNARGAAGEEPPRAPNRDKIAPFLRAARHFDAREIRRRLRADSRLQDSHPPLRDRLAALGELDHFERLAEGDGWEQPALSRTAAEAYLLEAVYDRLLADFDAASAPDLEVRWRALHDEAIAARSRLSELDAGVESEEGGTDALWERAYLWDAMLRPAEVETHVQAVLAQDAAHPHANLWLGQHLLRQGDDRGIANLEAAMRADPDLAQEGCDAIIDFLVDQGRSAEAVPYRERLAQAQADADAARAERSGVRASDRLMQSSLPSALVAELREELAAEPRVRRAYLGDKILRFHPEDPYRVLLIDVGRPWFGAVTRRDVNRVLGRVLTRVNRVGGIQFVLGCAPRSRARRALIRRVPGALFYDKRAATRGP